MAKPDFLKEHLNVWWLRPEQALWDAVASDVIAKEPVRSPSLDLGCGNGIYSFIQAGGSFGPGYDWFSNATASGFRKNKDSYDVPLAVDPADHIARKPRMRFDFAFDHKQNLLDQAARLGLYEKALCGDAQSRLPFADGSLATVFSNILYWLRDPAARFAEIGRVLRPGGRALLCLQDPRFKAICESYQWHRRRSELLRLLNRGRDVCNLWTASLPEIKAFGRRAGLRLVGHEGYLSVPTLRFWDVGLRPIFPPLLTMTQRLSPAARAEVKALWIETALPVLEEMKRVDAKDPRPRGYHFVVLERR
ncbi:MAG: methyltransferase domain-containing protein [Elusimicrobia bacterium]|nr:methyltransferase domain-containing protein [Elusimicrobiota bacterium]